MNATFGTNVKLSFQQKRGQFSRLMMTSALVAVGSLVLISPANAVDVELPTGGSVVSGTATFSNPVATKLDVSQSTDRAVINWNTFNIGADATVQFYQPSATSLTVNKVSNDGQFSSIRGSLIANGKVMILDPNGVMFGTGSTMDVGAIIASTGDVDNAAIMNPVNTIFTLNNFGTGEVINNGTINAADSGLVALVGPVVKNNGIINANLGRVSLAAGNETATVDLYGDGLVELAYTNKDVNLLAENNGEINAVGGKIQMTAAAAKDAVDSVVNMKGIARANSVSVVNGQIILSAKKVKIAKTANVKGKTKITAKSVDLDSTIDGSIWGSSAQEVSVLSDSAKILQGLSIIDTNGTINVGSGTYNEHLVVTKSGITLNGAKKGIEGKDGSRGTGETIIVPNSPGVTISADNVTVDGFTFTGALGADGYGIFVDNADGAVIKNNIITNNSQNGIYIVGSLNSVIDRNLITKTGSHGIYALESNGLDITNNQIGVLKGGSFNINGDGILLESSNDAYIFNNRIAQTTSTANDIGNGIHIKRSNNADVWQNSIYTVAWDGVRISKSSGAIVHDNDIRHAERVGVYATRAPNLNILNNYIDSTALRGIMLSFTDGLSTVRGNTINHAGIDGITIENANNVLMDNNVIGYGDDGLFNNADDTSLSRNGIFITASNNVKATSNKIAHTGASGIYVVDSLGLEVGDSFSKNIINFTGQHGIHVLRSEGARIIANQVGVMKGGTHNINGDGILLENSNNSLVEKNRVAKTTTTADEVGSGVHIKNSNNVDALRNIAYEIAWDGIKVTGGDTVKALYNDVDHAERAGLFAKNGSNITFSNNDVLNTGMVGVMVQDISGSSTITNNKIDLIGLDAVNVLRSNNALVQNNMIGYGDDETFGTADDTIISHDGVRVAGSTSVLVDNNKVAHANNGVHVLNVVGGEGSGSISITNNRINYSANDGILIQNTNPATFTITGNNVVNAGGESTPGHAGLEVNAGADNLVSISGNTFGPNFDYGLLAYSGNIDLTGATNTITNTGIGMAFYPEDKSELTGNAYFDYLANKLHLVGDTIGTTAFIDQSELFIDLGYGAFFAPGYPTLLDGNNATYTLGATTIAPSTNPGGLITASEQSVLENMINHYIDSQDRGLFFFNVVPELQGLTIDQKDVLRDFSLPDINGNSGSLTITGLPNLSGGAVPAPTSFNPNAIEPAAGDEETSTGTEDVAGIQPAAGNGENAACWSDANQALGQGSPVTFDFGSGSSTLLQNAVDCGNNQVTGQNL